MNDQERLIRFEAEMLPLMNDAYNLARWLVQNDEDARDWSKKLTCVLSNSLAGCAAIPANRGYCASFEMFVMIT